MAVLAEDYAGQSQPATPRPIDMRHSYDRYFETGLYSARYPVPNPNMLRMVLEELGPGGGRVLDFGCGDGRYALPLAHQPRVSVFAYDICHTAIAQLNERRDALTRAGSAPPRLEALCGSLDDLSRHLDSDEGFDLVVMLFGVLGHIEPRARRVATLRAMRSRLRAGGRLIVTVPNRARRFLSEQRAMRMLDEPSAPGDIRYRRHAGADSIELFYHLYTPRELCDELAEAGYAAPRLRAESVLSERMVLSSAAGTVADRLLCRLTPVSLAYGMVAIARPAGSPAG